MKFSRALISLLVAWFTSILFFIEPSLESHAQELSGHLTIHSATSIGLARNPTIRKAEEKNKEIQAQIGLVQSTLYPTITADLNGSYKKDPTSTPFYRFGGDPYNQYLFNLKATETLTWTPSHAIRAARMDQQIQKLELEILSRDLSGKIINAFYKVILDQKLLESLLQNEEIEKESLSTAQKRYKIGRGQILDVLQIKTQLALLSPKIAQARNQIQIDATTLAHLLGKPDLEEVRLQGHLIALPFHQIETQIQEITPRFPELEKFEASQLKLQNERELTLGKHLPSLQGTFEWTRTAFTKNELLNDASTGWTLGLQLSIPIFSGLSSIEEKRSYASRKIEIELEEENLRNQLALQQTQSSKNILLAWETIASATQAFSFAHESLKVAKKDYQFATIDFLKYLTIQQAYLEAKSSLFQAEYQYMASLVAHFIASGISLDRLIHLFEEQL